MGQDVREAHVVVLKAVGVAGVGQQLVEGRPVGFGELRTDRSDPRGCVDDGPARRIVARRSRAAPPGSARGPRAHRRSASRSG